VLDRVSPGAEYAHREKSDVDDVLEAFAKVAKNAGALA